LKFRCSEGIVHRRLALSNGLGRSTQVAEQHSHAEPGRPYGWRKESAAMAQCWRVAMLLVGTLEEVFLRGEPAQGPDAADAAARERWRTRYMAALERMQQAGIKTIADPAAGFQTYASLRARWDRTIDRLRSSMLYEAGADAPSGGRRRSSAV
jgi:hypothetical protein